MFLSLATISSYLKSKNIPLRIYGDNITVQKLLAFSPSVKGALCYFVGDNLGDVSNIENSIIICKPSIGAVFPESNSIIFTESPQLSFYIASWLFVEKKNNDIHSTAIVDSTSSIGKNVSIGAFSVFEECQIGDNSIIGTNVNIKKGTIIEDNVVIHSNTVVGAAGVMWTWNSNDEKVMCAQTGNVIVREGVFLGSNISIAKGAFENKPTIIGAGTMISHGTMIGHGAVIGQNCHLANNVSLAGSVEIGDNSFFGSGVTIRPHVTIPENAIVGAGAVVVKNFSKQGVVLVGNPARELDSTKFVRAGVPTPYSK